MCHHHKAAYGSRFSGQHRSHGQHFAPWGRFAQHLNNAHQVPVNILRKDDLYELEVFIPGKTREDFTVKVAGDDITVSYKGTTENGDNLRWIQREFNPNNFERTFRLNDTIDTELITARYDNGSLVVLLPIKLEHRRESKDVKIG